MWPHRSGALCHTGMCNKQSEQSLKLRQKRYFSPLNSVLLIIFKPFPVLSRIHNSTRVLGAVRFPKLTTGLCTAACVTFSQVPTFLAFVQANWDLNFKIQADDFIPDHKNSFSFYTVASWALVLSGLSAFFWQIQIILPLMLLSAFLWHEV